MNRNIAGLILFMLLAFQLNGQGYFHLAAHYAPTIWQDYVCTTYGDFITRADYDGDYISNNNWNNLGYPNKSRKLPAYVYYSVVESETHYFITYSLFHPADDFHCHIFSHENDLEGIIMTVYKDGTPYGKLQLVQLEAHNDFFQYRPPTSSGVSNNNEDIDGNIVVDYNFHPRVYVEGGGHGIRNEDTGGAPSVKYSFKTKAEDPDDVGYNSVGYDLLSIFSEFWERRDNCCGSGHLLDNFGDYNGVRFSIQGIGRSFDGDDGSDDAASTPWNWSDNDDDQFNNGDWFMDPVEYQYWQFHWNENYSRNYKSHPFLFSDLPDEIYNGSHGRTELNHGPYFIKKSINVLIGQTLHIGSDRKIIFNPNTVLKADGIIEITGNAILLQKRNNSNIGIKINGNILITNSGGIKFY